MNKNILLLSIIFFLPVIAFASNPSISSVDYNQFYAGRTGSFIVHILPDSTSGNLEFSSGGNIVSQQQFFPSTTQLIFSNTYSNSADINISFTLRDINGSNTDTSDDVNQFILHVKTGIDLKVNSIQTNPAILQPNSTAEIIIKVQNIGDENTPVSVPLLVYYNSTLIKTLDTGTFDINETKSYTTNWTPPNDYNGGNLRVVVNSGGYFSEFSLTNNELTTSSGVTSLADLVATKITSASPLKRNYLETITLNIANIGGRPVDGASAVVYLNGVSDGNVIYATTFNIGANSSLAINFDYSFTQAKTYKLILVVNNDRNKIESDYSNNEYDYTVAAEDYNAQSISQQYAQCQVDLHDMQARYITADTDKTNCLQALTNQRSVNESCTSNLAICNSNNSTKIANYMVEIDANREAEKTIYMNEVARIGREKTDLQAQCTAQIAGITDEKNQWSLMVIGGLILFALWLGYNEYLKRVPRKSVGSKGSVN